MKISFCSFYIQDAPVATFVLLFIYEMTKIVHFDISLGEYPCDSPIVFEVFFMFFV